MNSLPAISITEGSFYSGLAFGTELISLRLTKNFQLKSWQKQSLHFLSTSVIPALFLASGKSLQTVIKINGFYNAILYALVLSLLTCETLLNRPGEVRLSKFKVGNSLFSASIQCLIIWQINKRFRICPNVLLIPFSFFSKILADREAHFITLRQSKEKDNLDSLEDDDFFDLSSSSTRLFISTLFVYLATQSRDAAIKNCSLSPIADLISHILNKILFSSK